MLQMAVLIVQQVLFANLSMQWLHSSLQLVYLVLSELGLFKP